MVGYSTESIHVARIFAAAQIVVQLVEKLGSGVGTAEEAAEAYKVVYASVLERNTATGAGGGTVRSV